MYLNSWVPWNYYLAVYDFYHTYRTMPIALFIGIPVVALCYLLINIAFFAVLSYEDILSAEAVALVSPTAYDSLDQLTCCLFSKI